MRKSFNQFTYVPRKMAFNPGLRITIPGQAVGLRKMLQQYSTGMPLPQPPADDFYGDMDVPDLQEMDLHDIREYTLALKKHVSDLSRELQVRTGVTPDPVPSPAQPAVPPTPTGGTEAAAS